MKNSGLVLLVLALVFVGFALFPQSGATRVHVGVGINVTLPVFEFQAPPAVVYIPGTYVYTVPDAEVDILFYQGYWYRPYQDSWYRSRGYNGPWRFIERHRVPNVFFTLPPDYRHSFRGRQHIPYGQVRDNWRRWERDRYWDRHEEWHGERGRHDRRDDHRRGERDHRRGDRERY